MFTLLKANYWKKQELLSYSWHCGGNMNGNSNSITLSAYDENRALLTFSKADWYFQNPEVTEYFVDRQSLSEIRKIFLKYRMYSWEGRTFSHIHIDDGETEGYRFEFTEDTVHFSSQVFPGRYRRKLSQLDEVIETCRDNGELLPGLVLPERSDEDTLSALRPEDGQVHLDVYEYSQNQLYYRISNGTDKDISYAGHYRLCTKDGKELASNMDSKLYISTISANEMNEDSIRLEDRLPAGTYQLEAEGYCCEFEIR